MSTTSIAQQPSALRAAWDKLKQEKPGMRIRDCAAALKVSEAELLATTIGDYTTKLEGDWTQLLERLPELGRVMSLTRNEGCVLENKGPFQKIDIMSQGPFKMATVIGPIESRVFFSGWKYGFAVEQETPRGWMRSIQIFDGAGEAVMKVFLQEATENRKGSDLEAYRKLVADFKAAEQTLDIEVKATPAQPTKAIGEVDKAGLISDWGSMKDTHDFFGMIRKHQVNRLDAVILAEGEFTYRLQKDSLKLMLDKASGEKMPIMIFVGNKGNIQIHQGKVNTIKVMDNWLNVLDPDCNMHLREDLVDSIWVVKKPTEDGVVTAIEVFDANKEMIVQFFGLRKPGIPELESWRKLVDGLPKV
ncbi:MAG: ChuX/HutX family heme-like substrate-binding protein [Cyclobacteriaceae bacterium]